MRNYNEPVLILGRPTVCRQDLQAAENRRFFVLTRVKATYMRKMSKGEANRFQAKTRALPVDTIEFQGQISSVASLGALEKKHPTKQPGPPGLGAAIPHTHPQP